MTPPFPDICCHCMKPTTENMTVTVNGVKLAIPYCNQHLESAKEYYHNVVRGKTREITRKTSLVLGVLAGFWIVFWVLPESDLMRGTDSFTSLFGPYFNIKVEPGYNFDIKSLPLYLRLLISVLLSAVMLKTIGPLLDRYVLHRGAERLGYWINKRITLVVPGITEIKVEKRTDRRGLIACSITFLRKQYADLFRAELEDAGIVVT